MRWVASVSSGIWGLAFGWAAAVQYNDPDPGLWMLLYGVASGLSLFGVVRPGARRLVRAERVWAMIAGLGAMVSLAACFEALKTTGVALDWKEVFGPGGMMAPGVEEMREAMGLAIVSLRMAVVGFVGRTTSGEATGSKGVNRAGH